MALPAADHEQSSPQITAHVYDSALTVSLPVDPNTNARVSTDDDNGATMAITSLPPPFTPTLVVEALIKPSTAGSVTRIMEIAPESPIMNGCELPITLIVS